LAAEGWEEEAGDDGSGGDGGGGDGGGAIHMNGVLAGKICAVWGGSVAAAVAAAAAVGTHPETDSLVGGYNRHEKC
jgi:hypothetical protein